jgi:hypothetical protein
MMDYEDILYLSKNNRFKLQNIEEKNCLFYISLYLGKVHPRRGHECPEGQQRYTSTLPSTSSLYGGGCLMPHPSSFTPGNYVVPILQEAGRVPGPVLYRVFHNVLQDYKNL